MNCQTPLYHYTTIDVLKLILENRTIRFNKLTNTDDLEESKTSDCGPAGQYVFVSCWTNYSDENIPLWQMYANDQTGVRIGLPFIPFKDHFHEMVDLPGYINTPMSVKNDFSSIFRQYLPLDKIFNDDYSMQPAFKVSDRPEDLAVIYTDVENLLLPKIFSEHDDISTFHFGLIGMYKRSCWSFQKEIRYRIYATPFSFKKLFEQRGQSTEQHEGVTRIKNQKRLDFEYIDLKIDDECFKQMEITLGPRINQSQRIIVKNLVEKYNKNAIIRESQFFGKIRP